MYSWKSKFKFGKSKEEKEKPSKYGGFFNSGDSKKESSPTSKTQSSGDYSSDRKETIINSPNTMAPMRSSYEASSSTSTFDNGSHTSSDENSNNISHESSVSQISQDTASNDPHPQNTHISSSGIMTIKIYNGDAFTLPFPITSNQQILSKLLGSGISPPSTATPDVDTLVSQLSRVQLQNQGPAEENLLASDVSSKFIPATIKLPGSSVLNPLLYFTIEFDNTVATIEPEYGTMTKPVFNKISTFDVTRKLPFLKIDVFARIPSILLPSKMWQQEMSANDEKLKEMLEKINSNQDVHLDSFQLPINLKFDTASNIRLYNHHWVSLENGLGRINISIDYKPSRNKPLSIDDFDLLKVIGKGSFGKVMQVRKKDTQKIYALKAIRKASLYCF